MRKTNFSIIFVFRSCCYQSKHFKGLFLSALKPSSPLRSSVMTFKCERDFGSWLKKQTATAQLETDATCWTGAGWNLGTRWKTGSGWESSGCSPLLLSAVWVTVEEVRGLFLFLPCPAPCCSPPALYPFCGTYLPSLCLPLPPPSSFSPPCRLWSCFNLIEISLHTERTYRTRAPLREDQRGPNQ